MGNEKKYSWINIEETDFSQLIQKCPIGMYTVVSPSEAKELIPVLSDDHLSKADSVFIMCSGTSTGLLYYMANINRVENGSLEIDQDPLGFAIHDGKPYPSGCYLHHGDWEERTSPPPPGFKDYVLSSGIGNCFPLPTLPQSKYGRIEELINKSQTRSFQEVLSKIRIDTDK